MAPDQFFDAAQTDLWKLLEQRAQPDSSTEEIDRTIWDTYGDEGSVVFTDLCGFTHRSAELGITHFLQIIYESQRLLRPLIEQYEGLVFEAIGDSMLIWFPEIRHAMNCSIRMQQACRELNSTRESADQILLCVGIGYGRILRIGQSRLAGTEVNVASRLGEDVAEGYEILVSSAARAAATDMMHLTFTRTGVDQPGTSEVFRLSWDGDD